MGGILDEQYTPYEIDGNAADIYSEIGLVTMDDNLKDVDAVAVTLVDEYDAA